MIGKILKQISYHRRREAGANIMLTGVPRSGTTLLCRLLCERDNVIALNEPLDRALFPDPERAQQAIRCHFRKFRRSLFFHGTALARTRSGEIVDNAFGPENAADKRKRVISRTEVQFDKSLQPDFTLLMKHCAEFSLILPELAAMYPIFAMVRNPLAILASWHSVSVPVSRGRVAKSGRLNPAFHEALNNLPDDLLTRQLFILSWYFEQYKPLPSARILRYEDLMTNPDRILTAIVGPQSGGKPVQLESRNTNKLYSNIDLSLITDRLLNSDGAYWAFYDREQVETLAVKMKKNYDQ